MAMTDMARDAPEEPEYPYGLCLHLGKDELEKLGINVEDCKIGDEIPLDAIAKVTGMSQDAYGASLDLQITDLAIETDEDTDIPRSMGSTIYGDD